MKGSVDFATKSLILSFLLVLLVADPSGACTVSLTAQKIDGGVNFSAHAQASCPPDKWNNVGISINVDDGPWGQGAGCHGSTCDITNSGFGTVCMSEGVHKIGALANCTIDSACPAEPQETAYATFDVKWELGFTATYLGINYVKLQYHRNSDAGNSANPAAVPFMHLIGLPSGQNAGDLWIPNNLEGDFGLGRMPPPGDSATLVQSIACGVKVTQETVIAPVCPNCSPWPKLSGGGLDSLTTDAGGGSCPDCAPNPVNLWTGAFEYSVRRGSYQRNGGHAHEFFPGGGAGARDRSRPGREHGGLIRGHHSRHLSRCLGRHQRDGDHDGLRNVHLEQRAFGGKFSLAAAVRRRRRHHEQRGDRRADAPRPVSAEQQWA